MYSQQCSMKTTLFPLFICAFYSLSLCSPLFLPASMVSSDKGRRTTLTPSGPSSGTALLGPSLLDCNSHDSFQSRGLPDVAEVSGGLSHEGIYKWKEYVCIESSTSLQFYFFLFFLVVHSASLNIALVVKGIV